MIRSLDILCVLLVVSIACTSTSDKLEAIGDYDLVDNSSGIESLDSKLVSIDSLITRSYFNQTFLSELNSRFNSESCILTNQYILSPNIILEEFKNEEYFYLVLNDSSGRTVLHGSEIVHCDALFGELEEVLGNSFVWSYKGGCGSGEKKTWIEYDFKGEFLNSTDELLWIDKESSTILFKVLSHESEVFALNTDSDKFWKVTELINEETFHESYNWEFSKVDDKTIQGIYYSNVNDTILIKLD